MSKQFFWKKKKYTKKSWKLLFLDCYQINLKSPSYNLSSDITHVFSPLVVPGTCPGPSTIIPNCTRNHVITYTNFSRYFTFLLMLHHSFLRNHPFIIFFLLFMLFLHTLVDLYVFSKFSPFVSSVRSSGLNFYASHVSYLEHNSSQLEVSLSQKGGMRKNKDIPWKVIFPLFLSHVFISLIRCKPL